MKTMLRICALCAVAVGVVALASCKKENTNKPWDPDAKVYINSQQMPRSVVAEIPTTKAEAGEQQKLTPLEVVQEADLLYSTVGQLGLSDQNRDFVKVRIVGTSSWVVGQRGPEIYLTTDFIGGRDIYLTTGDHQTLLPLDTIAYIPNATMIAVQPKIEAAFAKEDYETCYKLFEEAFVFIPTTGKEYRELKAAGLN